MAQNYYDYNPESVTLDGEQLDASEISQKVLRYESFVNEVLKNDLKYCLEERDKIYDEISEYLKLQTTLERLDSVDSLPIRSRIDVGCNFYMQSKIEDISYVFVDIGMNLHVQMKPQEALNFIDKKVDSLNVKAERLTNKCVDIKSRIKLILEALAELQGLNVGVRKDQREIFT